MEVQGAIWGVHSTGTGQLVETQDVFFWRLAVWSAPTGLAIVHWIGCIKRNKIDIFRQIIQTFGASQAN